jgi:hypothetical protein
MKDGEIEPYLESKWKEKSHDNFITTYNVQKFDKSFSGTVEACSQHIFD